MKRTGLLLLLAGLLLAAVEYFSRMPACLNFLYTTGQEFLILLLMAMIFSGLIMISLDDMD